MSPEEARYAAVRKFGNITRVKEDTRRVWGFIWLDELWQDVRYGLRMLRKSPGFTAVAVLTLALGIGANTAIFSLIDAVLLRSLPVDKPYELVLLKWSARNAPKIRGYMSSGDRPTDLRFGAANPSGCSFSEPMFREIAKANQFSGVAAFSNSGPLALTGSGPATMINGQLVSGDYFHTLGVRAAGRVLEASDDLPAATPVADLNYGYWQSAFGGSHDVIGRTMVLNSVPFTIAGVAEQRFNGIAPGSDYDVCYCSPHHRAVEVEQPPGQSKLLVADGPRPPQTRNLAASNSGGRQRCLPQRNTSRSCPAIRGRRTTARPSCTTGRD